jgi:hypothetical protein
MPIYSVDQHAPEVLLDGFSIGQAVRLKRNQRKKAVARLLRVQGEYRVRSGGRMRYFGDGSDVEGFFVHQGQVGRVTQALFLTPTTTDATLVIDFPDGDWIRVPSVLVERA